MTEKHLKEGTTEKLESPQVALSLNEENSIPDFIDDVGQ